MLHVTPTKREQMAIDLQRSKAWLHEQQTYLNVTHGTPAEPPKVLTFPARTEATS